MDTHVWLCLFMKTWPQSWLKLRSAQKPLWRVGTPALQALTAPCGRFHADVFPHGIQMFSGEAANYDVNDFFESTITASLSVIAHFHFSFFLFVCFLFLFLFLRERQSLCCPICSETKYIEQPHSNSQKSICLYLQSSWIKGRGHHTQLFLTDSVVAMVPPFLS